MADIRRTYGEYTTDIWRIYGGNMANIQRTYGEYTANAKHTLKNSTAK